jgi:hypothetical protein
MKWKLLERKGWSLTPPLLVGLQGAVLSFVSRTMESLVRVTRCLG